MWDTPRFGCTLKQKPSKSFIDMTSGPQKLARLVDCYVERGFETDELVKETMEKGGDIFQAPERPVGKSKVRVVPDVYFLPRRSIPRTIALYSFLTAAGIGAGMLVEQWIKQQVENDTAILWRKKDDTETKET